MYVIRYFCLMEVNDKLIEKIASLARLKFDGVEKDAIKLEMQQMIAFIDKLNELNTTGVEPLLHMTDNINLLREDELKGSITTEKALENAPFHDGVYFKVPKVIDKSQGKKKGIA